MSKDTPEQNNSTIFCKVSIDNDQNWVHGIITYINLDKNIAEVFLSAKYFKNHLKEGSKIVIKSMDDSSETLFSGHITKKVISIRKQAITVQIDKVSNFANNRKYERFNVNYDCTLITEDGDESSAKLVDLSLGGCMAYSNEPVEENSVITVKVDISSEITLTFKSKVIRRKPLKNNAYSYGLQLHGIDEPNNILLNELVDYLTKQKKQIAHEWKVFKRLKYTVYTISILMVFIVVFVIFASEAI